MPHGSGNGLVVLISPVYEITQGFAVDTHAAGSFCLVAARLRKDTLGL
jgi:hypothetical protein